MLASRITPEDPSVLDRVADALRVILESDEANSSVRVAALEALGHLLALKADLDWPRELLIEQLNGAATNAEWAAAVTALANVAHPEAVDAVLDALAGLPLDEADDRELVYVRAAYHADAAGAERVLAGSPRTVDGGAASRLEPEVAALGSMRSQDSLPLLLAAAVQPNLSQRDRYCRRLGAGPAGRRSGRARARRLAARGRLLAQGDRSEGARRHRFARRRLAKRGRCSSRSRICRSSCGSRGCWRGTGWATAIPWRPSTWPTSSTRPRRRWCWRRSTIRARRTIFPRSWMHRPTGVGMRRRWPGWRQSATPAAQKQLLGILADDRDPLAADAAEAAGLADGDEFLLPLAELTQSRNKTLAMASLRALRRRLRGVRSAPRGLNAIFSEDYDLELNLDVPEADEDESRRPADEMPPEARNAIAEAVAALAIDAYVDADVRNEALSVAQLLGGEGYAELLAELADQAELEGPGLLTWVQAERLRLRGESR